MGRCRGFSWLPLSLLVSQALLGKTAQDLALELANPVSNLGRLSLEYDADYNVGVDRDGSRDTLALRVVVPVELSTRWSLISRTTLPFISQRQFVPDSQAQGGMGDLIQSWLISPHDAGSNSVSWGAGVVMRVGTAVDERLGAGQWGVGPSTVLVQREGSSTSGLLLGHIWGAGHTDSMNSDASLLQGFANWSREGRTLSVSLDATYEWQTAQMSLPLNVSVSKVARVGSRWVDSQVGLRYYLDVPQSRGSWGARLAITLLYPRRRI